MSHTYEVEIKSLLGSKENAEKLMKNVLNLFPDLKLIGQGAQLNHYFVIPEGVDLRKALSNFIPNEKQSQFDQVVKLGKKLSIRSRQTNFADGQKVMFVVKASVGDDTSSNGVKRIEFEVPVNISLGELDNILLNAGLKYQAKWSRERQEYVSGDLHICLDKNAGYGYLAEFEKVTTDENKLDQTKLELLDLMKRLGVEELAQDRLERMFAHYNANWDKYYGTENTFVLE